MFKETYKSMTEQILPCEELINNTLSFISIRSKNTKKFIPVFQRSIFRYGVTFIIATIICVAVTMTFLLKNQNDNITGLPTNDFILLQQASAGDRKIINNFDLLINCPISSNEKSSFVIVKAIDIFDYTGSFFKGGIVKEIKAKIIANIRGAKLSGHIKIIQWGYGDFKINSNILRKDGVYMLALFKNTRSENSYYEINGDLDVLFEIDDKGLVHSHSEHQEFQYYNNRPFNDLFNYIKEYNASRD